MCIGHSSVTQLRCPGGPVKQAPEVGGCAADLRADFDGRKHELNVSTYQMAILMLFNSADSLSYTEIQAATSIPPADLKRSLQSLACAKVSLEATASDPGSSRRGPNGACCLLQSSSIGSVHCESRQTLGSMQRALGACAPEPRCYWSA